MRLSEDHIFKGYWWLPENPNNKVAGILTYTPGESMCLELLGGFENARGEYIFIYLCCNILQLCSDRSFYRNFKIITGKSPKEN